MKRLLAATLLAAALLPAAVAGGGGTEPVPPDPATAWTGLPDLAPVPRARVGEGAAELPPPGTVLGLEQVLEVTLRNNPRTAAAWAEARAAWAEAEVQRADYYPRVDLNGALSRTRQSALGGQFDDLQTTYGPSVTLSYLLYDFGRRGAEAASGRAAFWAAAYAHNATLAEVTLRTQQAFYAYARSKALRDAADESAREAEANLLAAEERHRAGLATIADVLQARTARSQALLALQQAQGRVFTLKGALATQMGIPATAPYDAAMEPVPEELPGAGSTIETLVREALAGRPDLEGERARALESRHRAEAAEAERWPSLTFNAAAGRNYTHDAAGDPRADYWSASLGLRVPLFTGFERKYEVLKARAEAEAAEARAGILADQVVLEVWTAFYDLETARQKVATSRDLVASAAESEEVALGRYKAGVGTILDLLAAQNALAGARAQRIEAVADWYLAVARLSYSTGRLTPGRTAPTLTPKEPPHE